MDGHSHGDRHGNGRGSAPNRRAWLVLCLPRPVARWSLYCRHARWRARVTALAGAWLGGQVAALRAPVDLTLDAFDWRALRDSLSARGIDIAGGVTARSWIQAGKLGVALGATTPIVCACDDPHHLPYRKAPAGYPAIIVEQAQPWKRGWRPASVALSDRLGPIDSLGAITLARAGQPAVTLVVYRRYGAALVTHAVYHRSRSISAPAAKRAAANAFCSGVAVSA